MPTPLPALRHLSGPSIAHLTRARLRILLLMASLTAAARPGAAAEWFVSPLGSDTTGAGSMTAPFRTLGHTLDPANAIVAAGDTVTLRAPQGNGVFNECEVRLRVPLTLRSFAGERAHIHCAIPAGFDPQNGEQTVAIQIDPDASGSVLQRLEISGSTLYGVFLQTDWFQGGPASLRGASDVLLEDLYLHDTGRDAIKITPHADRVTVRRCRIERTGAIYPPGTPVDDKNAEGIDNVNGSGMGVEDCLIRDTATTGLYFKGGAADVLVQRNRIENAGAAGILVGFDTSPEFFDLTLNPDYYEALRAVVRNNLVDGAQWAGIGLYASRDALVANNTVLNSARQIHAGLYFGVTLQDFDPAAGRPPNRDARILNNLVVQDGGDCAGIRWANEIDANGLSGLDGATGMDHNAFFNRAGACRFFDNRPGSPLQGDSLAAWRGALGSDGNSLEAMIALAADGHLLAGSAAIDRGAPLAEVAEDIDRDPRRAPPDIGADEFDALRVFRDGFENR